MQEVRICKTCFEKKPLTDYYFRKDSGKYGTQCKKCVIAGKRIIKDAENKVCKHCGVSKPFSEYQKAGGGKWLQPYCKPCDSERKKKWVSENADTLKYKAKTKYIQNREEIRKKERKKYYENHSEVLRKSKEYREKNKERINKKNKENRSRNPDKYIKWRKNFRQNNKARLLKEEAIKRANRTPEQRERDLACQRAWHHRNKERANKRSPEKMAVRREQKRIWCNMMAKTNPAFKLLKNLRSRTRFALLKDGALKSSTTEELLGCSIPDFKKHFESLFKDGMSWERFMQGDIHIDHIRPCCKFDLSKPEEQKACFHYTNLQPLWKEDNLIKGTKEITIQNGRAAGIASL